MNEGARQANARIDHRELVAALGRIEAVLRDMESILQDTLRKLDQVLWDVPQVDHP